jgi:hypothetical protein
MNNELERMGQTDMQPRIQLTSVARLGSSQQELEKK